MITSKFIFSEYLLMLISEYAIDGLGDSLTVKPGMTAMAHIHIGKEAHLDINLCLITHN